MAIDWSNPRWASTPAATRRNVELREQQPFRTPMEYVRWLGTRPGAVSPGQRRQMQDILANPDAYEVRGQTVGLKPSWAERNPALAGLGLVAAGVGASYALPALAGAVGGSSTTATPGLVSNVVPSSWMSGATGSLSGGKGLMSGLSALDKLKFAGDVVGGVTDYLGRRSAAGGVKSAAQIQADAALQAGEWQQESAAEQLRFLREQAEIELEERRRVEEANFGMARAREKRLYGQAGDEAFNLFGLTRHQRRLGFNETAADRANRRAELLGGLRTGQGRFEATQRRIGRLGSLLGAPQPAGGREIAPLVEPTALVQPEWVALDDPRQTAFEYPEYVRPTA